jgi:hypothetical protein
MSKSWKHSEGRPDVERDRKNDRRLRQARRSDMLDSSAAAAPIRLTRFMNNEQPAKWYNQGQYA